MPIFTVSEIAHSLNGEVFGNPLIELRGLASVESAGHDQIVLAIKDEYRQRLRKSKAQVAIISNADGWDTLGLEAAIVIDNPRMGLALSTQLFQPKFEFSQGIHPSSYISQSALIEEGCSIGPFCYIGDNVHIGQKTKIADHVSIYSDSVIGQNGLLNSGVRVGSHVSIGDFFKCHANTVIGCDGFSFETKEQGSIDDVKETLGAGVKHTQSNYYKVYSLGSVRIGDHVEIGACTAIDRGTLIATSIGSGTKLDNLVHIAHNVQIGRDCLICGQVGIAGSAKLGDRVVFGGQVGVKDHIKVGNDVIAGGATKIFSNVSAGKIVMGSPAVEMTHNIAIYKALRKLPKLLQKVKLLEQKLGRPG